MPLGCTHLCALSNVLPLWNSIVIFFCAISALGDHLLWYPPHPVCCSFTNCACWERLGLEIFDGEGF